jgi:hypothetical protein
VLKINLPLILLAAFVSFSSTAYARCITCEEQLAPPRNDIIVEHPTNGYEP